jgi:hypothetical protein
MIFKPSTKAFDVEKIHELLESGSCSLVEEFTSYVTPSIYSKVTYTIYLYTEATIDGIQNQFFFMVRKQTSGNRTITLVNQIWPVTESKTFWTPSLAPISSKTVLDDYTKADFKCLDLIDINTQILT